MAINTERGSEGITMGVDCGALLPGGFPISGSQQSPITMDGFVNSPDAVKARSEFYQVRSINAGVPPGHSDCVHDRQPRRPYKSGQVAIQIETGFAFFPRHPRKDPDVGGDKVGLPSSNSDGEGRGLHAWAARGISVVSYFRQEGSGPRISQNGSRSPNVAEEMVGAWGGYSWRQGSARGA